VDRPESKKAYIRREPEADEPADDAGQKKRIEGLEKRGKIERPVEVPARSL